MITVFVISIIIITNMSNELHGENSRRRYVITMYMISDSSVFLVYECIHILQVYMYNLPCSICMLSLFSLLSVYSWDQLMLFVLLNPTLNKSYVMLYYCRQGLNGNMSECYGWDACVSYLTHWGRVTHICASKLTIIGSDNGLSPGRRQAIIWNNVEILSIGLLGTNFSEFLIEILAFSFKKMRLKVSSAKWRPFCLGLNVLIYMPHVIA